MQQFTWNLHMLGANTVMLSNSLLGNFYAVSYASVHKLKTMRSVGKLAALTWHIVSGKYRPVLSQLTGLISTMVDAEE